MPKRSFKGSPIDATMQYVSEALDSGSVEVPGDGDKGEERTDAVPSFVDRDEYKDAELKKMQAVILNPDSKLKDLAEQHGYNYPKTSSFLATFRRKYKEELRDADLWDAFTFRQTKKREPEQTYTENEEKSKVKGYFKQQPDASLDEAIEALELSQLSRAQIGSLKGSVHRHMDTEETEEPKEPPASDEELREDVDELQDQVAKLADGIDSIATDVAVQQQRPNTVSLKESVSDDTLFAIVSGDGLTDEQRREVFEVLV